MKIKESPEKRDRHSLLKQTSVIFLYIIGYSNADNTIFVVTGMLVKAAENCCKLQTLERNNQSA